MQFRPKELTADFLLRDIARATVGDLFVVRQVDRRKDTWLCRCECGRRQTFPGKLLREKKALGCDQCCPIGRGRRPASAAPSRRVRSMPVPPRALSARSPARPRISILLTPGEHALLERLRRYINEYERSPAASIQDAAARAIACCADWPDWDSWRTGNAEYMARYREDWEREAQSVPLAVEFDARAAKALRHLAAEMDWLLEDAARFAIRNLCDAYDDQVGLGETPAAAAVEGSAPPSAPVSAPAAALPLPAPEPPAIAAPPPIEKLPDVVPPTPKVRPAPPRPQATPARPRVEAPARPDPSPPRPERERCAAKPHPAAETPTKPRITHTDIAGDEEVALIRRWQGGDRRAGDVLLEAHERLILKMAMRYRNRGLDDDDLLQWARMGFLRAATKWSEDEGAKLSTYAGIWMKQHLQRAVDDQAADIRVPVHMQIRIRRERRRAEGLSEEAAEAHSLLSPLRLDAPIGDEVDGATLGEMTAGEGLGPEAATVDEDAQARRRELIGRAMTWLTPKEQEVVRRRLLVHDPETLEELGASFDLTRERIRQIEAKAMRKLEKALRMIMAKDDAVVLWDGPLPAPVAPRQLPPLPPPAPPPPAPPPRAPAVEPAPISVVATAAPAPEPPRAKPIPPRPEPVAPPPPPPPSPPQPRRPLTRGEAEAARVAAIRPLRPPTRKPAGDAVAPAPRSTEANRALWELA